MRLLKDNEVKIIQSAYLLDTYDMKYNKNFRKIEKTNRINHYITLLSDSQGLCLVIDRLKDDISKDHKAYSYTIRTYEAQAIINILYDLTII